MDEFLQAYTQHEWNRPVRKAEFRIYYDPSNGQILTYSMENIPGTFITVDAETFHKHRFDCVVKNGKLEEPSPAINKLQPGVTGTPTHAKNITVIADGPGSRQWGLNGS